MDGPLSNGCCAFCAQFMRRHTSNDKRKEKAKAAWGSNLTTLNDIIAVFVGYTTGVCNFSAQSSLVLFDCALLCNQPAGVLCSRRSMQRPSCRHQRLAPIQDATEDISEQPCWQSFLNAIATLLCNRVRSCHAGLQGRWTCCPGANWAACRRRPPASRRISSSSIGYIPHKIPKQTPCQQTVLPGWVHLPQPAWHSCSACCNICVLTDAITMSGCRLGT